MISFPRWVRSNPDARTDRLPTVSRAPGPPPPPPAVSVKSLLSHDDRPPRRPRTLRIPAVPDRGLRDRRHALAAAMLDRALDDPRLARGVDGRSVVFALDQLTPSGGDNPWERNWSEVREAAAAAVDDLREDHARYLLHRDDPCARCTPAELCPWHYARLRSWWNARDRVAVALVASIDAALADVPDYQQPRRTGSRS